MSIDWSKKITAQAKQDEALQQKREAMIVSNAQARVALKRSGMFGQIKQDMDALPDDDEVKIAWEKAQNFTRFSPTMLAVAESRGLSDTQLDDLFTVGMGIEL